MTPPFLCHTRRAAIRWERDFTVLSSKTWNTKDFCFMEILLSSFSFCSVTLDCFAYFDPFLSHVALPFIELIDPVKNSIERTHDQRSVELQVLRQQHRVEEGNYL